MMQLAARPGRSERSTACLGRQSRQQVQDRVKQALASPLRDAPDASTSAPGRAPPRRSAGRRDRPSGDNPRVGRRSGRSPHCRARGRGRSALSQGQNERSVRKAIAKPERIDRAHGLDPKSTGAALISERAVDETVAKTPSGPLQAPDESFSPHGLPGRRRRATLRPGPPQFFVSASNSSRIFSAPSLPPGSRVTGRRFRGCKCLGERLHLRGLPGPFPAFELMKRPRHVTPFRTAA